MPYDKYLIPMVWLAIVGAIFAMIYSITVSSRSITTETISPKPGIECTVASNSTAIDMYCWSTEND